MSLALIFAAAIVLIGFLLASVWLRSARSRRDMEPPVTEAQARAHALPLTRSILSVGPRSREREDLDA